ncbi:MAG: hypothetical protein ACTSR2_00760 [Candidatus Hodarchaeales archaeon]
MPNNTEPFLWVKKLVTPKDWNKYYSLDSSYCYLGLENREGKKFVKIGFVVAERFGIPKGCELLTDEECREVDLYRRNKNIFPTPLS